jgi:hypothetical protein
VLRSAVHAPICQPLCTNMPVTALPHMPTSKDESPTLRLLVAADVDLDSACALADRGLAWDSSRIDAVLACGLHSCEHEMLQQGLATATLVQLESIVCRVLYTASLPAALTPQSRNLHLSWISLAPGLGCAGLCNDDNQRCVKLV